MTQFEKDFPASKFPYRLTLMPKGDHVMVLTLAA